jgi:hypothetical protein
MLTGIELPGHKSSTIIYTILKSTRRKGKKLFLASISQKYCQGGLSASISELQDSAVYV